MTELSSLVWLMTTQFAMFALGWGLCSLLVREQRAAVAHWAVFMLLLGAGMVLTTLRDDTRQWWAFAGANLCFLAGFTLLARGMARFMDLPLRDREYLLTLGVFATLFGMVGPSAEQAYWRVLLAYGSCVWVLGRAVVALQAAVRAEFGTRMALLLATPLLLVIVAFSVRLLQQLLTPGVSLEMHHFTDANRGMLYVYSVTAAMYNFGFVALLTLRHVQRLRDLTLHDPLTGLLNRRALDAELVREWQRLQRDGEAFALLALDLDHFKHVNDRFGHLAGDEVLAETAARLQVAVRGFDLVARTGGEEFVVLMPRMDADGARAAAERLRLAVSATPYRLGSGDLPVSVSVGVAWVARAQGDPRAALQRADRALYQAKAEGRDRIVMAPA